MAGESTVTFVFEAGVLRRRGVRNMLRLLDFHNHGRMRWIEVKSLLFSQFTVDGDRQIIDHLQKVLDGIDAPSQS